MEWLLSPDASSDATLAARTIALVHVLAVDWSGRVARAEESIWLAEVDDGELVDLRNGLTREGLVSRLIALVADEPRTVVGLDFAFSFPRWWCAERRWSEGRQVWAAMGDRGEDFLAACVDPFWGRPGKANPHPPARLYRRTDREEGGGTAKSVFQIGGAGAVGTGSIRGMPHLLTLAENGFSIWPFTPDGWPRVVEIYPRALTGPVNKGRWADRHAFLFERFAGQSRGLLERAAGSEDAFDAAASALVMARHGAQLAALSQPPDPEYRIEGMIWRPV
jgi:hypothetical protein